jgi:putative SOS response-associated peptidase YedK
MRAIHDRQPVVLEPDLWDSWTDLENNDRHELESILVASGGVLMHYRIGPDVGNVRNDNAELAKAVPEGNVSFKE